MTTAATRRDSGDEPIDATTPPAAYVGLFQEPQYTVELPPLDDDDAFTAHLPAAPVRHPGARG
jgi:hypothetical protein